MNAVGYIRVSTEEQAREGISLAHQRKKIVDYARLHDINLIDYYGVPFKGIIADEGVSAKDIEGRKGAKRVLELARDGKIDAVIIYKLDRIFRNAQEALNTAIEFNGLGVAFHSVTEKIDTQSAMGKFFFTIMAACAEMERNLISERTRDALRHKKANGEVYNHIPYGYTEEGGRLVRDPAEQAVIEAISIMRTAESPMTFQSIADILNKNRVPSKRGGRWYPKTVRRILL